MCNSCLPVDLHRRLEGCVRIETPIELGLEHRLALPARSVEELRPYARRGPTLGWQRIAQ